MQKLPLKMEVPAMPATGRNFGGIFLKFGMVIGKGLD